MNKSSNTYLPENTYTLEEFIKAGRSVTISYDALSFKEVLSNGTEISILNVVNDYLDDIRQYQVTVLLDDKQYEKYRFKPKLLCHDVYGNPELYYIILLMNYTADVKEFDFKKIKMLNTTAMNTLMSYIYNAEKSQIDKYNTDHNTN